METKERYIDKLAKYIMIAAGACIIGGICWYFRNILIYILIAVVVSLVAKPIMKFLRSVRIKGWKAPDWVLAVLTLLILSVILPFIIAALAMVHLLFLHETGSNNPTGIPSDADKIPFHPYYTIKDILGILLLVLFLMLLVLFAPDLLGDPDNYTPANPLNTPPHIKPE